MNPRVLIFVFILFAALAISAFCTEKDFSDPASSLDDGSQIDRSEALRQRTEARKKQPGIDTATAIEEAKRLVDQLDQADSAEEREKLFIRLGRSRHTTLHIVLPSLISWMKDGGSEQDRISAAKALRSLARGTTASHIHVVFAGAYPDEESESVRKVLLDHLSRSVPSDRGIKFLVSLLADKAVPYTDKEHFMQSIRIPSYVGGTNRWDKLRINLETMLEVGSLDVKESNLVQNYVEKIEALLERYRLANTPEAIMAAKVARIKEISAGCPEVIKLLRESLSPVSAHIESKRDSLTADEYRQMRREMKNIHEMLLEIENELREEREQGNRH